MTPTPSELHNKTSDTHRQFTAIRATATQLLHDYAQIDPDTVNTNTLDQVRDAIAQLHRMIQLTDTTWTHATSAAATLTHKQ